MTYISWSSDFALYLEDYLLYELHISRLWVNMTQHLTSKCRSLWHIFYDPVILPYILKTIWYMNTILWYYESVYYPMFDLKINVGHCDLYFMVQWFCLIAFRLFDVWTSYFRIMSQYDLTFDFKINVGSTYILWSSDFALYLEAYLIYEHHTLGLWVSMTRCST